MLYSLSPLQNILDAYRRDSRTEREKGTYFEELIRTYLRHEPIYADLYAEVWLYSDWVKEIGHSLGHDGKDTGIDLVARTRGTNEFHAIQCKCYAPDRTVRKVDIDSFFTASGQQPFTHRLIVTTTNLWTDNAESSLIGQTPPVTKIDLHDLENSRIDWAKFAPDQPAAAPAFKAKKSLRPHQESALTNVKLGLQSADRGKLIMACGTGKTFTSLKIAEELAGKNKRVLFLVPSLNLLSQTLTEWTQESAFPLHSFAVCSDAEVGKKRNKDEDIVETLTHELRYPATTDAKRLAFEMKQRHDADHMSVVFSTYHSIDVISRAQHLFGLPGFDLVVCDEAHRTTGATFDGDDQSNFVKIHDNAFIRATKRLYMTATPRIYGDMAKATAEKDNTVLYDMNDVAQFGKQLHVITFSEAVQLKLLTDYKVLVLTIDEAHVSARIQDLLKDDSNQLNVDDAARIIGCWKALSKTGLAEDLSGDPEPMRRAVAFCQVIERSTGKHRKVSSKEISGMFQKVVAAYQAQENSDIDLICEAAHVDGSMNATEKETKLNWLKAESPENTCRILSNVRCLSEGVDVPALDAVLFLTPRNSQVDVVQSVGRVMRNAPGKKRGYVILPVVIPVGMEPHDALNDNKVYKVVWQVLQALRSHDDTFDAMINKLDLIGSDRRKMEVISITDEVKKKSPSPKTTSSQEAGKNQNTIGTPEPRYPTAVQPELQFQVGELERALYAKVVKKCGNPNHWEEWAADIAKIAKTHISRITQIVGNPENTKEVAAFQAFANELRDDLNDSITDSEVIEMLAQHLITKPVFDALFEDYSFASHNPVSMAMQQVLEILQEHRLEKEADTLEKFYASVKLRAASIDDVTAKQKIVVELYDKFFRNAFPRMTERLGIVYTPVEVVDFIIHSINDLLQSEFGQTLGSKGVHIIDPFTGTGTFVTRLLQSGLISKEQLPHKYKHEIHANEIVLLAYYIAAINIEAVYHSLMKEHAASNSSAPTGQKTSAQGNALGPDGKMIPSPEGATPSYEPFQGICLTDTFQLYEKGDMISDLLSNNSDRRKRQKALDIRVIMGNPPYSAGQDSANDDAKNISYSNLDKRISDTFIKNSLGKGGKRAAYDSYIRAIRWGSDRIGTNGIVGYISGSGFLEKPALDGMRATFQKEFTKVLIFNLRGDIRKNMLSKGRAREGENIFGNNSMTGISISFFVKGKAKDECEISYWDIGDDLSEKAKLEILSEARSIGSNYAIKRIENILPNSQFDWINQRDQNLSNHILTASKRSAGELTVFEKLSNGIVSNRDPWVYGYSLNEITKNCKVMIDFFNSEIERYKSDVADGDKTDVSDFVQKDETRISWGGASWKSVFKRLIRQKFDKEFFGVALYRPFTKAWHYGSPTFNHSFYTMPAFYPTPASANLTICVAGVGARSGFSVLIANSATNLHTIDTGQCFPLYLYEKTGESSEGELFSSSGGGEGGYTRRDAITDAGLAHFQAAYPGAGEGNSLTKEDLFYYIYGLLHSPDYRSRYADNLGKELPRIPAVKTFSDFRAFSQAGRDLAHWHLHYETVECFPGITLDTGKLAPTALTATDYRVTKMKFAKRKDPETGKNINDKTTVIYNERITIKNIPLAAYDYIVNGKPALEWVMERQSVTTDKDSNITNDANHWATETMNNPKYPLELFLRVITVSLETNRIVASLPKLEI